jgi:hypothetical protein
MIDPKQIPDEVVEAVEKVLSRYLVGGYTLDHKESIAGIITAAALSAWPGAWRTPYPSPDGSRIDDLVILPLPKDSADE